MLQQNSGNPDKIAIGLKAIVEHMYGNHSYCQEWCRFLKDPEKYRHRNLPYGKDLTDESLRTALSSVFTNMDTNKLAFLSSTQANESFNNTVASKAPKARHYSDSSSLQYRLYASVSQKNEGYGYIADVHKDAGLSPGASAKRCGVQLDKQTAQKREHQVSNADVLHLEQKELAMNGPQRQGKEILTSVTLTKTREILISCQYLVLQTTSKRSLEICLMS